MSEEFSTIDAAEIAAYWNAKARANVTNPSLAVGVDDEVRTRCIESAQHAVLDRAIRRAARVARTGSSSVLDFGCGVGRWAPILERLFDTYHGVDISDEMLEIARTQFPGRRFSRLDGFRTGACDASYDLAFSVAVLHHNPYLNQEALLGELGRVVRPGGQLLMFESVSPRINDTGRTFYPRPESDWIGAVERRGFRHIETVGTCYAFAERVFARALPGRLAANSRLSRLTAFLDSRVMPHLAPLLPRRYHERLAFRFEKLPA